MDSFMEISLTEVRSKQFEQEQVSIDYENLTYFADFSGKLFFLRNVPSGSSSGVYCM